MRTREHFEETYASKSDPWRYDSSVYEKMRFRVMTELTKDIRAQNVLDAGCGPGQFLGVLSEECPQVRMTGLDWSAGALHRARQRLPSKTRLIRIDAYDYFTSPPGDRYDLIVCSGILECMSTQVLKRVLGSIRQHCTARGNLLVVESKRKSKQVSELLDLHGWAEEREIVLSAKDYYTWMLRHYVS